MVLNLTNLKKLVPGVLAIGAMLSATSANAQVFLAPNTGATAIGTVGFFGGSQVGGTLSSSFTFTSGPTTIAGTIRSIVFTGGSAGANGTGGTSNDFYYQIDMNAGSDALQSTSVASFLGFNTGLGNVITDVDGAGPFVAGGTVALTGQRNFTGSGLVFDFGAGVAAGATSATLVVRTNATSVTNGSAGLLGASGVAANAAILAPLATANGPEPGTLALVGLGIAGLVARRRKH